MGKVWGDQSSGGRTGLHLQLSLLKHLWLHAQASLWWGAGTAEQEGFVEDPHHCSHCYHLLSSYYARRTLVQEYSQHRVSVGIDVFI